ncbi:uncharacterized protein [Littorina saxatilis]|uniref:uncharacterized protein isoform X2 n=1 Tax=Littorina saxatilis TaxID=31220 RepID=UPI0038B437B6
MWARNDCRHLFNQLLSAKMEFFSIRCLIILFSCLHLTAALKPGEGCSGSSECEANSQCTSPDVGGTCDCKQGFVRFTDQCLSNSDICKFNFSRTAIKAGSGNFVLKREPIQASDIVTWYSSVDGQTPVLLGSCPPLPGNCTQTQAPQFLVTRPTGQSSHLTILDPRALLTAQSDVSVVISSKVNGADEIFRLLDLYNESSVKIPATQLRQENGRDWVWSGNVVMSGVSSLRNCEGCSWYQVNEETKEQFRLPDNMTSFDTQTTTCAFRNPRLPEKNGIYTYKVYIRNRGLLLLGASSLFTIRHPAPPVHNCPAMVAEGDTLQCDCIALDRGLPNRTFAWTGHSSNHHLAEGSVGRQQHGTVFTCSEQSGVKVTYTLRVAYGPSSASIVTGRETEAGIALTCIALDVNPTPSFTWRNPDTGKVLSKGQKFNVKVGGLTEHQQIECEAKNYENKGKVATASIRMDRPLVTQFNYSTLVEQLPLTSPDDRLGVGVVIGIFVMLPLVVGLAGILAYIHYKKRKSKTIEGIPTQEDPGCLQFVDILDRNRSETGETTDGNTTTRADDPETASLEERGYPGASNYDALDQQALAHSSPYDNLDTHNKPSLSTKPKPSFYREESGPLYANREDVLESPIYVNTPSPQKQLKKQ